jgi:hypothetical protein
LRRRAVNIVYSISNSTCADHSQIDSRVASLSLLVLGQDGAKTLERDLWKTRADAVTLNREVPGVENGN